MSSFRGSVKRRGGLRSGLQVLSPSEDGGVLALVAGFLPVAVLTMGMVLDLETEGSVVRRTKW